jgi:hypothetical protein
VLQKVLSVQDFIATVSEGLIRDMFRVAFGATMVTYSNYSYEPSLGRRSSAGRDDILDFLVAKEVENKISDMADDAQWLQQLGRTEKLQRRIVDRSFFEYQKHMGEASVDIVVTSPPYVNNYHYNRNTRPHLYWLGFAEEPSDIKPLENDNFGTYWQTARGQDLIELNFDLPDSDLAERIGNLREKNPEKGVYGGHGWANYASQYFNDCWRFCEGLNYVLKPGATALVVIGPSILQGIFIPTDRYLGKIAERVGLVFVDTHVPRSTRVGNSIIQSGVRSDKASDTDTLYEAVVELRKL